MHLFVNVSCSAVSIRGGNVRFTRIFPCPSGASSARTARTSPAKTAGRASTASMALSVSVTQAFGGKGDWPLSCLRFHLSVMSHGLDLRTNEFGQRCFGIC